MALSATLLFYGQLTKSGAGVTGKSGSITATIKKLTRGSTPTITTVSTGGAITVGSVTEIDASLAKGVYVVGVSGLDPAADYLAGLHYTGTASDVDLVDVPALQSEFSASINAGAVPQVLFGAAGGVGDTQRFGGTTVTGRDIGANVLLSAGTGTGQLDFTGGVVKANLWQILGTVLTETAGQIAAAFKKFFDIGSPTSTANRITLVDTVTTNTDMRGTDSAALAATALSTAVWTNAKAGFLTGDAFVRIGANGAGLTSITLADASLTTAKLGTFVLAKTTNITGFNDIAAGAAMTLTGAYDAAKTAAQANSDFSSATFPAMALATSQPNYAPAKAGDKMDLVNAPNATAITAIQSGLATASNLATLAGKFTGITSIGNWLRAAMRKTAPDTTALSEINAVTNSLTGTYDATADSTQAIAEGGGTSGATVGQIQAAFGPGPYGPIDDESTFIDDMATRLLSDPTKKITVTDAGVVVDGGNVDTVNNPVQTVGASGDGTQPVDQTTIATDGQNMLVEVSGSPASGVVIKAYRASDWDTVPRPAPLSIKGKTVSLDDGTWENALLLTSSIQYVINFEMPDVSVQRRVIVP